MGAGERARERSNHDLHGGNGDIGCGGHVKSVFGHKSSGDIGGCRKANVLTPTKKATAWPYSSRGAAVGDAQPSGRLGASSSTVRHRVDSLLHTGAGVSETLRHLEHVCVTCLEELCELKSRQLFVHVAANTSELGAGNVHVTAAEAQVLRRWNTGSGHLLPRALSHVARTSCWEDVLLRLADGC